MVVVDGTRMKRMWLIVLPKSILLRGCLFGTILVVLIFVILPLILATITVLRQQLYYYKLRIQNRRKNSTKNIESYHPHLSFKSSSLYAGRVWHTRFLPIKHSFTYPIFIFGLNLDDIYCSDSVTAFNNDACRFQSIMWPLSLIVSFNPNDHLKNGEGNTSAFDPTTVGRSGNDPTTTMNEKSRGKLPANSLPERIFRFIQERTDGSFVPTIDTHSIFLVTHLTYFGYCFNPVSFYYIHERNASQTFECVIGEVSNTPWNEMYCYVLHPNSTDHVHCSRTGSSSGMDHAGDTTGSGKVTNPSEQKAETVKYIFPKQFHVSPFMEMDYNYEWKFTNFSIQPPATATQKESDHTTDIASIPTSIHIINNLRPIAVVASTKTNTLPSSSNGHTNGLQFSAVMHVHRYSMHPYRILYYMIMYPMYCMIIQIWIHVQAFYLFSKGIAYQPHPLGSETSISRFIGRMMEPFFYIRDQYMSATGTTSGTTQPQSSSTIACNTTTDAANPKSKIS